MPDGLPLPTLGDRGLDKPAAARTGAIRRQQGLIDDQESSRGWVWVRNGKGLF